MRCDRPGWIPADVGDDWDPDPYAYQTEEEQMPAGRYQSLYIKLFAQMLDVYLERLGLVLLFDLFIFYRDKQGIKQRTAPDIVIARYVELSEEQMNRSYDLEVEPVPLCVMEITSAKSHKKDLEKQGQLYASWSVPEYLVLDVVDQRGYPRDTIQLTLWRLVDGSYHEVAPDSEGFLTLERIGVRIQATGRRPVLRTLEGNHLLRTAREMEEVVEAYAEQVQIEAQRAEAEAQRAEAETQRAEAAEQRIKQLEEELRRSRGGE